MGRLRAVRAAASAAALGVVLALAVPGSAAAQDTSLQDQINALTVAPESNADTYDRDAFGDSDRDAILERNFDAFPDCEGYFSRYDGQCYALSDFGGSKDAADDEVEIDHAVALKEAWISGASEFSPSQLEQFGSDPANLTVMTASLNASKGADDVTGWIPPREASVCQFVGLVVDVKTQYDLSVDQAEQDTLLNLASNCDTGNGDTGNGDTNNGDTNNGDGNENTGSGDTSDGDTGNGDSDRDSTAGSDSDTGNDQITQVPTGGVETGGDPNAGSTTGYLIGGLMLTASAGAATVALRRRDRNT